MWGVVYTCAKFRPCIRLYLFMIICFLLFNYLKQRNHSFVIIRDLKEWPWLGVQRLPKNKVKDWVLTWEQQPQLKHGQHKKLLLIWIMLVSSTQGLSRLCILWHWVVLYLRIRLKIAHKCQVKKLMSRQDDWRPKMALAKSCVCKSVCVHMSEQKLDKWHVCWCSNIRTSKEYLVRRCVCWCLDMLTSREYLCVVVANSVWTR
jgi:hypothetical protein